MIEDYLVMRPERFEQVAEYVRTGRLSIGPFYTLTDEFLVSGESIIRNLEKGLAQAATFGVHTPVDGPWAGYMPDQFGHIGQFPQILQMFDIDRAVILRGAPASLDRSTFMWRSPDGSEVLTEYLIHGYFVGADIANICNEAAIHAARASAKIVSLKNFEAAIDRSNNATNFRKNSSLLSRVKFNSDNRMCKVTRQEDCLYLL